MSGVLLFTCVLACLLVYLFVYRCPELLTSVGRRNCPVSTRNTESSNEPELALRRSACSITRAGRNTNPPVSSRRTRTPWLWISSTCLETVLTLWYANWGIVPLCSAARGPRGGPRRSSFRSLTVANQVSRCLVTRLADWNECVLVPPLSNGSGG